MHEIYCDYMIYRNVAYWDKYFLLSSQLHHGKQCKLSFGFYNDIIINVIELFKFLVIFAMIKFWLYVSFPWFLKRHTKGLQFVTWYKGIIRKRSNGKFLAMFPFCVIGSHWTGGRKENYKKYRGSARESESE